MGAGILFLVLILGMVSCKTKPETPEPESPAVTQPPSTEAPVPTGISQDLKNALNEARQRAETARDMSIEVNGPVFFPAEWDETESQYLLAKDYKVEETEDSYREATGTFTGIALSYEAITADSIPMYAEECRGKMLEARSMAIATGVADLTPDRFIVAEEYGVVAEAAWETGDYPATIANAKTALPYYLALGTGGEAFGVRQEILDRGFAFFDQSTFDAAEDNAEVAIYEYDNENIDAALDNAQMALSKYNIVLRKAWYTVATQEGNTAAGARKAAVDMKAPVAVKQEFDKADVVYKEAQNSYRMEAYQNAAESYTQSVSMFQTVRELADYKRQQAESAIRAAEQKVSQSEHTAQEAEAILEGGAQ